MVNINIIYIPLCLGGHRRGQESGGSDHRLYGSDYIVPSITDCSVPTAVIIDPERILGITLLVAVSVYSLMYWPKRSYIVSRKRNIFHYYIGSNLIMQSHLHNICILLRQDDAADGKPWAYIVVYGYQIEPVTISGKIFTQVCGKQNCDCYYLRLSIETCLRLIRVVDHKSTIQYLHPFI